MINSYTQRVFTAVLGAAFFFISGIAITQEEAPAPEDDDRRDFVISLRSSEIELNPLYTFTSLEAQLFTALYEGLVSYDPVTLVPIDGVAQRWDIEDDGLTYTFYLNPDARYSNGDPVLADHFRSAWLKMLSLGDDAKFGFLLDPIEGASEYRQGTLTDPDEVGIRVASENELEITLEHPTGHFLSILAHQSLVAIHPDQLEVRDWNSIQDIIGNGPYVLAENTDQQLVFSRNEEYWDDRYSYYDRIIYQFNNNPADATSRFNSGEVQWLYSGFDFSQIRIPNSLQITPQFATSYYFFSAARAPFDDPRIRRALLLLLPLEEIRSSEVHFVPSSNLVLQIPGYPEVQGISEMDQEEALRLLSDAGYPNGQGLPPVNIVLTQDSESERVASLMESSWADQLGLEVSARFLPYREYLDTLGEREFVVGSLSWVADYADPMSFLQLWDTESTINDAGFSDPTFDELLDASNGLEGRERFEQLAEAEEYLLQSAIVLPVSHSPAINVIDLESVGGWYPNPLDIHPFKYVYQITRKPPANIASQERLNRAF